MDLIGSKTVPTLAVTGADCGTVHDKDVVSDDPADGVDHNERLDVPGKLIDEVACTG